MNIAVAIVDDEEYARKQLIGFLEKAKAETGLSFTISQFGEGMHFLESCERQSFDLVLMDVDMPLMSGLETAVKFRKSNPLTCLIFITNMLQYAVKGYEVDALDFVIKPVSYNTFLSKIEKARAFISKYQQVMLTIRHNSQIVRIDTHSIRYVEVTHNTLQYHTEDAVYRERNTMKNAVQKLNEQHFALCNSCYLVNLRYVTKISADSVSLGETELQMSRNKKKDFLQALNVYIGDGGV